LRGSNFVHCSSDGDISSDGLHLWVHYTRWLEFSLINQHLKGRREVRGNNFHRVVRQFEIQVTTPYTTLLTKRSTCSCKLKQDRLCSQTTPLYVVGLQYEQQQQWWLNVTFVHAL